MKRVRTEKQKTPIGQEIVVDWFLGSTGEVDKLLNQGSGVGIKHNGARFVVTASKKAPGTFFVSNEDDESETEPKAVSSVSELFSGEIEFCELLKA